jgi:aminopeptidase-like protein
VLTGVGDAGNLTYKRSRRGDSAIDRAVERALGESGVPARVRDYVPLGYDERQYNSLGVGIDIGCVMRTPHGEYAEYHTSADDLAFVRPASLQGTFERLRSVMDILESNRVYLNLRPKCEPQLGRRGLFRQLGGTSVAAREAALLWVLSLSDGRRDLLAIAEESGLPFESIRGAAESLAETDLLETQPDSVRRERALGD